MYICRRRFFVKLINTQTGEILIGEVKELSRDELKDLQKNRNFKFDWLKESKYLILQINMKGETEILGLMSITDIPKEFRIHINLIESAAKHRGKGKQIDNIAGCLISYCCKLAFKKGYDGFVSLIPKTQLIQYYQKTYGFVQVGTHMAVLNEQARLIISKYQTNEEI